MAFLPALVPKLDGFVWLAEDSLPVFPRPPLGVCAEHDLTQLQVLDPPISLDFELEDDICDAEILQGEHDVPVGVGHRLRVV